MPASYALHTVKCIACRHWPIFPAYICSASQPLACRANGPEEALLLLYVSKTAVRGRIHCHSILQEPAVTLASLVGSLSCYSGDVRAAPARAALHPEEWQRLQQPLRTKLLPTWLPGPDVIDSLDSELLGKEVIEIEPRSVSRDILMFAGSNWRSIHCSFAAIPSSFILDCFHISIALFIHVTREHGSVASCLRQQTCLGIHNHAPRTKTLSQACAMGRRAEVNTG